MVDVTHGGHVVFLMCACRVLTKGNITQPQSFSNYSVIVSRDSTEKCHNHISPGTYIRADYDSALLTVYVRKH